MKVSTLSSTTFSRQFIFFFWTEQCGNFFLLLCLLQISEAKSEEINFSEIKVFLVEKRQTSRHRHICSSETDNCLSEIFRMNFDISLKWKSFLNYINTKILISSKVVNSDQKKYHLAPFTKDISSLSDLTLPSCLSLRIPVPALLASKVVKLPKFPNNCDHF